MARPETKPKYNRSKLYTISPLRPQPFCNLKPSCTGPERLRAKPPRRSALELCLQLLASFTVRGLKRLGVVGLRAVHGFDCRVCEVQRQPKPAIVGLRMCWVNRGSQLRHMQWYRGQGYGVLEVERGFSNQEPS